MIWRWKIKTLFSAFFWSTFEETQHLLSTVSSQSLNASTSLKVKIFHISMGFSKFIYYLVIVFFYQTMFWSEPMLLETLVWTLNRWMPLNGITDNRIKLIQFDKPQISTSQLLFHSLITIYRLLESVSLCSKVIPISGAYCTYITKIILLKNTIPFNFYNSLCCCSHKNIFTILIGKEHL